MDDLDELEKKIHDCGEMLELYYEKMKEIENNPKKYGLEETYKDYSKKWTEEKDRYMELIKQYKLFFLKTKQ